MSDLSRLLEDVYRSGPAAPAAPSWSSDAALEDAFADWVPGPPDDAPAAEREFADTEVAAAEVDRSHSFDQLDSLVQQALGMGTDDVEDEPALAPEPVAVVPRTTWCRQDDDILPSRGLRRRRPSLKRR